MGRATELRIKLEQDKLETQRRIAEMEAKSFREAKAAIGKTVKDILKEEYEAIEKYSSRRNYEFSVRTNLHVMKHDDAKIVHAMITAEVVEDLRNEDFLVKEHKTEYVPERQSVGEDWGNQAFFSSRIEVSW